MTAPRLTVQKIAAHVPIPTELLLEYGLITEEQARAQGWTPPAPLKISRWLTWRLRWWNIRERLGRRIGGWIAGVDLFEDER